MASLTEMIKELAEVIHKKILNNISDDYEKTVGYPTYDLTKATAIALAEQSEEIEFQAAKIDVENLHGEELAKFVKQRKGTIVKPATRAKGVVTVIGNGVIAKDDIFATENSILFRSLESKEIIGTNTVKIEAVEVGTGGNVGANSITQIPKTIQGIEAVNNPRATTDGFNRESDELLRERYLEELRYPTTSGNEYMFLKMAKEVPGVGDVKAEAMWNGIYTMKLYILDSNKEPADISLVERAQTLLDPLVFWGQGKGSLPSGCFTTIASANAVLINIDVNITYAQGADPEQVKPNIVSNISRYLKEIAFKQTYASYAKIANAINDTEGVLDYENLTINSGTINIDIPEYSVATIGTVVWR